MTARCPQCQRELPEGEFPFRGTVRRRRCYDCCAAAAVLLKYWHKLGLHVRAPGRRRQWFPWIEAMDGAAS